MLVLAIATCDWTNRVNDGLRTPLPAKTFEEDLPLPVDGPRVPAALRDQSPIGGSHRSSIGSLYCETDGAVLVIGRAHGGGGRARARDSARRR